MWAGWLLNSLPPHCFWYTDGYVTLTRGAPASPAPPAIAVLAFFAFRPRKGWLRRRASAADGMDLGASSGGQDLSPVGGKAIPVQLGTGELDSFLTKQSFGSQSHGSSSLAKAANRWECGH